MSPSSAYRYVRCLALACLCAPAALVGVASACAEDQEAAPKYTLTLENDDMGTAVTRLHHDYELRVCLELVPEDIDRDFIRLEDEVARLRALAVERELSASEKAALEKYLGFVERGDPPDTVVGRVFYQYSGTFAGDTPAQLLDALCAEGPYGWFEENGTYVILPRAGTTFGYPVTLDAENMPILDVFKKIAEQDPKEARVLSDVMVTGLNPLPTVPYSEGLGNCIVPRLVLESTPAIEAMCRAVEAAGGQLVWVASTEIGWSGGRTISIRALPALKKLWYPNSRDEAPAQQE